MKIQNVTSSISTARLCEHPFGNSSSWLSAFIPVFPLAVLFGCGSSGDGRAGVIISGNVSEFGVQLGLALVSAAGAYQEEHTDQSIRVGVVNSSIDSTLAELARRSCGGGDWQGVASGLVNQPHARL